MTTHTAEIATTFKSHEPLTQNGFTVSEELEILSIVERMRRGEEKIYSAEEATRYLGLDN